MKNLLVALVLLSTLTAQAQKDSIYYIRPKDGLVFRLEQKGRRISLYSRCYDATSISYVAQTPNGPTTPTTIMTHERALFFRKEPDSDIQRLSYHNLRFALADDPASSRELSIAGVDLYLGIGLLAAGTALTVAGFIQTAHRNSNAQSAFKKASTAWYNAGNANAPLPTLPHYSPSPLVFIGPAIMLTCIIPFVGINRHARKALEIYNGIE